MSCAGKDDAALHYVVVDKGAQRAGGGRAEDAGAIGGGEKAMCEGMCDLAPREGALLVRERRSW